MFYKIFFIIIIVLNIEIKRFDVKTAFLYNNINEKIFIKEQKNKKID